MRLSGQVPGAKKGSLGLMMAVVYMAVLTLMALTAEAGITLYSASVMSSATRIAAAAERDGVASADMLAARFTRLDHVTESLPSAVVEPGRVVATASVYASVFGMFGDAVIDVVDAAPRR